MYNGRKNKKMLYYPKKQGLYDARLEHDACGIGAVVNINGHPDHSIIDYSKELLLNLHHRGASGADETTGDGAGILFQIPDEFFQIESEKSSIKLPQAGKYAAGMVFLPKDEKLRKQCEGILEKSIVHYGMKVLGWRDVPISNNCLGKIALAAEPSIRQIFVDSCGFEQETFELKLYLARRRAEKEAREQLGQPGRDFYIRVTFIQDNLLQRDVHGLAVVRLLPGFGGQKFKIRTGGGSSAVQHKHISELAVGAAFQMHRAQRRNKYA